MKDEIRTLLPVTKAMLREVRKVVVGKDEIIAKILVAMLAGGHVLIEDTPGVGKTTMALAISRAFRLAHNRMQFTPDALPADVIGFSVYNKASGKFEFKPGVVMCNLFLADEINRTSPKTQSALLEVMEESQITVDGVSRPLPKPFLVIATQNPIGSVGTQMLPESQLDRFMIKLTVGYPDAQSEVNMLKSRHDEDPLDAVSAVASAEEIIALQQLVRQIYVDDRIYEYITALAGATRSHPMAKLGVSPRGSLALCSAAKATALLRGRDYVIPEDVTFMLRDVFAHRILLNAKARLAAFTVDQLLDELIARVEVPAIGE